MIFAPLYPRVARLEDTLTLLSHGELIRRIVEGKTPAEIKAERAEKGLPKWDIWTEGCPGGE